MTKRETDRRFIGDAKYLTIERAGTVVRRSTDRREPSRPDPGGPREQSQVD